MNIQARVLSSRKNKAKSEAGRSFRTRLALLGCLVMIFAAAFVVINAKISLAQELSFIETGIAKVETEMHKLDREIEDLRLRKEKLMGWEHVNERIASYGLPLRPAAPEQSRLLVVSRPHSDPAAARQVTAENRSAVQYGYSVN